MSIEINSLETKRFGITAARVTDPFADLKEINRAARAQDVQMLTLRIDTGALARVHHLEDDGYRLMDTLVYYSRSLSDLPAPAANPEGETIRPATPEDASAVAAVARASFANYFGHYHADPRLSGKAADEAYVEWATKSVESCDAVSPVYVAESRGRIVAFLTTRIGPQGECEIPLNGVHPEAQGAGMYGRILEQGMKAMKEVGCDRVVVSTQINNIAVQRAWGRRGFRMIRSSYTLHKWF
jgi:ribosomal protein S18 acetylase RimI-like enzyme